MHFLSPTLIRSGFHGCSLVHSSIHRTAGCGPACPVVWQGRTGDRPPYADFRPAGRDWCTGESGFHATCGRCPDAGLAEAFLGLQCVEYEQATREAALHAANPVKRGLVAKPDHWKWSLVPRVSWFSRPGRVPHRFSPSRKPDRVEETLASGWDGERTIHAMGE